MADILTEEDARQIADILRTLDNYSSDAGVSANDPARQRSIELIHKLQEYRSEVNANLAEETKQFRVLLCLLMACIGDIELDLTAVANFGADPTAFKVDINPSADGTKVRLTATGTQRLPVPEATFNQLVGEYGNAAARK